MRATIMYKAGDVRVENVPDARLVEPTDAVIRITRTCICGSDLWPYKELEPVPDGRPMGHEAIGVVESVGTDVHRIKRGDLVVMPFAYSDGTCAFCHEGLQTACSRGGFFGVSAVGGAQAEAVRVPLADGTLYKLPVREDDALIPSLLTLSDVMGTGHHAAVTARVSRGRIALAQDFGATDVVSERGEAAVEHVRKLTSGTGVHSILECVGSEDSMRTSVLIARAGAAVGRVGVPHYEGTPASHQAFYGNISVGGGPAPVRAYIEALLPDILEGRIHPGLVFDQTIGLDQVPAGYRAMNERQALKVLIKP
jgi:threonine dehydrogenase-like Zn-dependent dehydrogenase